MRHRNLFFVDIVIIILKLKCAVQEKYIHFIAVGIVVGTKFMILRILFAVMERFLIEQTVSLVVGLSTIILLLVFVVVVSFINMYLQAFNVVFPKPTILPEPFVVMARCSMVSL